MSMTLAEAQHDNRRTFVGGGPGAFISGLVWLAAAYTQHLRGIPLAFAVLFLGGMFIFPLTTLITRTLFHRAPTTPANTLGRAALESTFAMIGGLFAAWLILPTHPAFTLPLAAIAVGTHYFAFRTVYGDILFWLLGALITLAGILAILQPAALPISLPLLIGLLELAFGILLTTRASRRPA